MEGVFIFLPPNGIIYIESNLIRKLYYDFEIDADAWPRSALHAGGHGQARTPDGG